MNDWYHCYSEPSRINPATYKCYLQKDGEEFEFGVSGSRLRELERGGALCDADRIYFQVSDKSNNIVHSDHGDFITTEDGSMY